MKLTSNFSLSEFTRSNNGERLGIKNEPTAQQIASLQTLCSELLQPLRDIYGESFHINSGFRSAELNKIVGGVPTSQHTKGEAADIRVADPRKLQNALIASKLEFDQAILYPTFLHLSFRSGSNRNQILFAKGVKP